MSKPTADDMLGSSARRAQRRLNTALGRMSPTEWRAWFLAPLAVVGAFFVVGLSTMLLALVFEVWEFPVTGFFAAFAVVSVSYIAAPRHKAAFALFCFVAGATVAWFLLDDINHPENNAALSHRRTLVPFWVTLSGGGIALLAALTHSWRSLRGTAPRAP